MITAAPAARLRAATSGRKVSTEITTSLDSATAATTGTTRSISSVSLTSAVSGENGTPPMSTQPAPAASAASAASTARSRAKVRPWSKNESGVRLTMPITTICRAKSNLRRPMVRTGSRSGGR